MPAIEVKAEFAANVFKVLVKAGDTVSEGDEVAILESMKMEIPVTAPVSGTVTSVGATPNTPIGDGGLIVTITSD